MPLRFIRPRPRLASPPRISQETGGTTTRWTPFNAKTITGALHSLRANPEQPALQQLRAMVDAQPRMLSGSAVRAASIIALETPGLSLSPTQVGRIRNVMGERREAGLRLGNAHQVLLRHVDAAKRRGEFAHGLRVAPPRVRQGLFLHLDNAIRNNELPLSPAGALARSQAIREGRLRKSDLAA